MNKKILLSTILASSVLAGNQAMAGILFYNNNDTSASATKGYSFKVTSTSSNQSGTNTPLNNASFYSLFDLGKAIAEPYFELDEPFPFDDVSEKSFQIDLLNPAFKNGVLRTDMANSIAKSTGDNFTVADLNGILVNLQKLKEGYGVNAFDEIELTNLLEIDPETLQDIKNTSYNLGLLLDAFKNIDNYIDTNAATIAQLAATNEDVKLASETRTAIQNIINSGQASTLDEEDYSDFLSSKYFLFATLNNLPQGQAFVRSAQGQENLKDGLNASANLKASSPAASVASEALKGYLLNPETVSNADLPSVQKSDAHTTSGIMAASLAGASVLAERISGFVGQGVGAGDIFQTYGAWVKGTMGVGEQKAFKKESGYKFNQRGATIGVDTGDESMIGAAFTIIKNDITNKDSSSTKDKMDTMIGSIYGMYAATQEVFVSGQFSYGKSKIKKSRNTGDLANNKATAKPSGTNLGGRAEVGYVYAIDDATQVVPSIGFAMNKIDVKGYSEKGNGLNRTVGKRTSTRNSGLVGVALKHTAQMESMKVMPEIHANLDYAFSGKNSATNITLGNNLLTTSTPSEKISQAYFNIGGSVKFAASEAFDVTAGYDMGLAKKFMSHTGALKLRVNF